MLNESKKLTEYFLEYQAILLTIIYCLILMLLKTAYYSHLFDLLHLEGTQITWLANQHSTGRVELEIRDEQGK